MAKKKVTPELIDKAKFESLVHLGLTNEELYTFFMVSNGALMQWIKLVYNTRSPLVLLKKIRIQGKIEFMESQRLLAMKDHVVSIWLGKNYYNQKDTKEEAEATDFEDLNPLVELLKEDTEDANSNN